MDKILFSSKVNPPKSEKYKYFCWIFLHRMFRRLMWISFIKDHIGSITSFVNFRIISINSTNTNHFFDNRKEFTFKGKIVEFNQTHKNFFPTNCYVTGSRILWIRLIMFFLLKSLKIGNKFADFTFGDKIAKINSGRI